MNITEMEELRNLRNYALDKLINWSKTYLFNLREQNIIE